MALWGIFISSFILGFSGAMMPGPMLGITIDGSLKKGYWAGPLVVLGHGILELALITVMILGLKDFFSNSIVAGIIGMLGGVFLGWMGIDMVKSGIKKTVSLEKQTGKNMRSGNLVVAGALVSATNPYFIMWWASTGIESIRQAYAFGFAGVLLFFIGHILSDFSWFSAISIALSRGEKLVNDKVYHLVILLLGVFIIAFSIYFIASGYEMLF